MIWEIVFIWYYLFFILFVLIVLLASFRKYRVGQIRRETPDMDYIFFRYQANIILKDTTDKNENFIDALKQMTRLGSK